MGAGELTLKDMMISTRKKFGIRRAIENDKSLEKCQDLKRSRKKKHDYQKHGGIRSAKRGQGLGTSGVNYKH